jgi:hypothetical protein
MSGLPVASESMGTTVRHVVVRACPICPVRRALAARAAAEIRSFPGFQVEAEAGGLGEISVTVDGRLVFYSRGIFTSPNLEEVMRQVRLALIAAPV